MATLVDYKGLQVVDPDPTGAGGLAIQEDLKALVDWHPRSIGDATTDPGAGDDIGDDFYPGSLWLRTNTTPPKLFVCRSNASGSAVWDPVLLKVSQDTSPKLGGNLDVNGQSIVTASNGHIALMPNGTGKVGVNTTSPAATVDVRGTQQILIQTASDNGLVIRGATSQTGKLTQWEDTPGHAVAYIYPDGSAAFAGDLTIGREFAVSQFSTGMVKSRWFTDQTNSKSYIDTAFDANVGFMVFVRATTTIPVAIRGYSGQTANLQQWQSSSGSILAAIDKDGGFVFNEQGADVDCRIEGDTDANLFYTDAGNDRVGIGTSAPAELLDVDGLSRAESFTADGDVGSGVASTIRLTGVTDTPTTNPGWTSSNSAAMNAPDGYIKMYVGTQAVVVPYWNT